MHVAIVSEEPCYPANAGTRIRLLNLMLHLARRHRITWICRDQGNHAEAEQAREFLAGHGVETILVDDPVAAKKGPLTYVRLAANLLSPLPLSVQLHNSRRMHQAMQDLAARQKIDVWQLEWLPYVTALRGIPGARSVVVAIDVLAQVWQRYLDIERRPLHRWFIRRQLAKFRAFEQQVFREAHRVVAVSPTDAQLIRKLYGVAHVAVVDNGVDNAQFQAIQAERQPRTILFLGAMDYRPNQDAARLLLEELFPAVRARHPDARLVIVGRRVPAALAAQALRTPGTELHADVPDVRPFLATCTLMAVPLRVGGGSRLKILEALAAGCPVVSTRVGAEGLALTAGRDLVVVERVEAMAAALCHALDNPALLRQTAHSGNEVVRQQYDWSVLADRLERIWEDTRSDGPG